MKRTLRRLGIFAVIYLVVGWWLYASSGLLRVVAFVYRDPATKIEGIEGSIAKGFSLKRFRSETDQRLIEVEGFRIRYSSPISAVRKGVMSIDNLQITSVVFNQTRIEKPAVAQVNGVLLGLLDLLKKMKFDEGKRFKELQIGEVKIDRVSYQPALGVEPLIVGPIEIQDLIVTREGWRAEKFAIEGRQIRMYLTPGKDPNANPVPVLMVQIPVNFFADAKAPLVFSTAEIR